LAAIGSLLFFSGWDRVRRIVAVKVNTLRHDAASVLLRRVMVENNPFHDSRFVMAR
jgi:hypothetical protein